MKIKVGQFGKSCDVDAGAPRILWRIFDGQLVISRVGVPIENDLVSNLGDIKRPVHLGTGVARYRTANLSSKKVVQKIA